MGPPVYIYKIEKGTWKGTMQGLSKKQSAEDYSESAGGYEYFKQ